MAEGDGEVLTTRHADAVRLRRCDDAAPAPGTAPLSDGVEVDEADWQALCRLAHRTYVPASEESRARGAGAGSSDND